MKNSITARFSNILPRIKNPQPILSHTKSLLPKASKSFPFSSTACDLFMPKATRKVKKKFLAWNLLKSARTRTKNGDEGKLHDAWREAFHVFDDSALGLEVAEAYWMKRPKRKYHYDNNKSSLCCFSQRQVQKAKSTPRMCVQIKIVL